MSKLLKQAIEDGSTFVDERELSELGNEARQFGYYLIINSFFDGVASVQLWYEN